MSAPMPTQAPELMTAQAELTDLRYVALHALHDHARGAYPDACRCASCRAALRWVPAPDLAQPFPTDRSLRHLAQGRR